MRYVIKALLVSLPCACTVNSTTQAPAPRLPRAEELGPALNRARWCAPLVDTIVVPVGRLDLQVGDLVTLSKAVPAEGRTASGDVIAGFIPVFLIETNGVGRWEPSCPRRPAPTGRLSIGALAGYGDGPSRSGVLGASVAFRVGRGVALRAEVSKWVSGVGFACAQSWPQSYACDVRGVVTLLGIHLTLADHYRLAPYGELSGGIYARHRVAQSAAYPAALAVETGLRLRASSQIRLGGGLRYLRMNDSDYRTLMGARLDYLVGVLRIELALQ